MTEEKSPKPVSTDPDSAGSVVTTKILFGSKKSKGGGRTLPVRK